MTWYVAIPRVNGRINFFIMADMLRSKGFGDRVEYHEPGWMDLSPNRVLPHLKFEYEDDAIAYVLTFGGEMKESVPCLDNKLGE